MTELLIMLTIAAGSAIVVAMLVMIIGMALYPHR